MSCHPCNVQSKDLVSVIPSALSGDLHLFVDENPLQCDSRMQWIKDGAAAGWLFPSVGQCVNFPNSTWEEITLPQYSKGESIALHSVALVDSFLIRQDTTHVTKCRFFQFVKVRHGTLGPDPAWAFSENCIHAGSRNAKRVFRWLQCECMRARTCVCVLVHARLRASVRRCTVSGRVR